MTKEDPGCLSYWDLAQIPTWTVSESVSQLRLSVDSNSSSCAL